MLIFDEIFSTPPAGRSWQAKILWWEVRRIPYNLILGICGIASILIMETAFDLPPSLPFAERDWEPFSIIIFAVLANIFYTAGWIVELLIQNQPHENIKSFAPRYYYKGLVFSVWLAFLPGAVHLLSWVIRFVKYLI